MLSCTMVGLDTSTTNSGFCVYRNGEYFDSGVIDHSNIKNAIDRTNHMCNDLGLLLDRFTPDIVVIERPPYCNNPNVLINLAEIVGFVKGYCYSDKKGNSLDFVEYEPNVWRKHIAGDDTIPRKRNACKNWDIIKASSIIGREPIDDNEADAVLLCEARCMEFQKYE